MAVGFVRSYNEQFKKAGGMRRLESRGRAFRLLARRVLRESSEDDVLGAAAELGYYFLLALFPMLIFLTSLIGFLPDLQRTILEGIRSLAPPDAVKLVNETMSDIVANNGGGLLSVGVLGTLWAASTGTAALIETLNRAYEVKETRSYLRVRLVAIVLTIGLALLNIVGAAIVLLGGRLSAWVVRALRLAESWHGWWTCVSYLFGLALFAVATGTMYRFGPNLRSSHRRIAPGSIFSAVGAVIASALFSAYLRVVPSYSATYGGLGAVIVLMLWLYLMGLIVLIGAEINSEIEKLHEPSGPAEPRPQHA